MPVLVRPNGEDFEIIAGERRWTAAQELELASLEAIVRELDDAEALKLMLVDNLQRAELDPMEEARSVRLLVEKAGLSPQEISDEIKKSISWVELRQGLLDLPGEVGGMVTRREVSLNVLQMVLDLPQESQEEGLQIVLHPTFQDDPLNARQAELLLESKIIEPARLKKEWEARTEELKRNWTIRLSQQARIELDALNIQVVTWGEKEPELPSSHQAAEDEIYLNDRTDLAPEGRLRWLNLAQRHGVPVIVYPWSRVEGSESPVAGSLAVVDSKTILLAEQAREEHGGEAWLSAALKKKKEKVADPDEREDQEEVEREEVRESREVTRSYEMSGWVDLKKIMLLKSFCEKVLSHEEDTSLPEDFELPELLAEGIEDQPELIAATLSWVLSFAPEKSS